MFDFKKKKLDPVLSDAFRALDKIVRAGEGNRVEKLLELEEDTALKIEKLRSKAPGYALFGGLSLGYALTLGVMSRPHAAPGQALAGVFASFAGGIGAGLAAAVKPALDNRRAARDGAVFTMLVDSYAEAAADRNPQQALESPRYRARMAPGKTFRTYSSKDQRPARLRYRVQKPG